MKDKKKLTNVNFNSISDYEVFLSEHKDITQIESILEPCEVLDFSEYEKIEDIVGNVFYTRATYDPVKVRILIFYLL